MKQVIVVNAALRLPPGKMAAQCAHAAVGAFLRSPPDRQARWLETGMAKIVVRCASESDLMALAAGAEAAGLAHFLVRDAGRTVVSAGTATCLGIGPDRPDEVDRLTRALALA
jgi:peptidyl-tRNA hydrolase